MSATDEFLTIAEIAELLKLNQQTVRNWIDRGEMRAVRVGHASGSGPAVGSKRVLGIGQDGV